MIGTIYKIVSPSGRLYIGQTWDFIFRKYTYKSQKGKGQSKLNNSFLKYGFEKHIFEILYQGDCNQEELDILEIKYISENNCISDGLNIREGGSRGKHSDETKMKFRIMWANRTDEQKIQKSTKLSLIHKGKKISQHLIDLCSEKFKGSGNPSAKSIFQYTKNGEFIREWPYMKLATIEYEIDLSDIVKCCRGKIKSAGGYKWKYKNYICKNGGWEKVTTTADP